MIRHRDNLLDGELLREPTPVIASFRHGGPITIRAAAGSRT
jgi:hypothetical protein